MSHIAKSVACAALAACSFAASASQVTACPQNHASGGKAARLAGASVFDGSPAAVNLVPDAAGSEWDVAVALGDVKERVEAMRLVCRYKGTAGTVTLKMPYSAASCKVQERKSGLQVACRALPRAEAQGTYFEYDP